MDRGAWQVVDSKGRKESDMTERLGKHASTNSI